MSSTAAQRREEAHARLVDKIASMGYPREFGHAIAVSLGTEKTMNRMLSWLLRAEPRTPEAIADEMLAIVADRDRWVEKKKNEYYNRKYNEFLYTWNPEDEDDGEDW